MRLDREQQIAEIAEHVRPDRLALEAARKPGKQLLVDRHREVIAPELCQALYERTIGAHGLTKACARFAQVDGPQELRQLLQRGGRGIIRARLARGANLLPQLERLR